MKSFCCRAILSLSLSLISNPALAVTVTTNLDTFEPPSDPAYYQTTNLQTGRQTRDGNPSSCSSQKFNPGEFTVTGSRRIDQYKFVALSTGSVIVTLSNAGDSLLFAVAYDANEVNPDGGLGQNYILPFAEMRSSHTRPAM